MNERLWQPDSQRVQNANITAFKARLEQNQQLQLPDYAALHQWSVDHAAPLCRKH